jgi:hypothetical protein
VAPTAARRLSEDRMPNTATFELALIDVRGNLLADPRTEVQFFDAPDRSRQLGPTVTVSFDGRNRRRFTIPAIPEVTAVHGSIHPSRCRARRLGFFTPTANETVLRSLTFFRDPDKVAARFTPWAELGNSFAGLRRLLERSPELRIRGGKMLGTFTGPTYDDVRDDRAVLAKAGLLNLHAKLSEIIVPGTVRSWFSQIEEIIAVDRERIVGRVNAEMAHTVRDIKDRISEFDDYKHTPAGNHFTNFPAWLRGRYGIHKTKMYSIKSRQEKGNIQLTIAPGTDVDGGETFFADLDIDENGVLLRHLADVFEHKFTGGVHPFDIHEIVALHHPGRAMGYELV